MPKQGFKSIAVSQMYTDIQVYQKIERTWNSEVWQVSQDTLHAGDDDKIRSLRQTCSSNRQYCHRE